MSLKEIEYGSLASSSDMNNNFSYLDNKIAENTSAINIMISSILSNIATINSRIADLSSDIKESVSEVSTDLTAFKNDCQKTFNKSSMIPAWGSCFEIETMDSYNVNINGYILIIPTSNSVGDLIINNKNIPIRNYLNVYDNSSQLSIIPVAKGDIVSCTFNVVKAYFLPCADCLIDRTT